MSLGELPKLVPFASWAELLEWLEGPSPDRERRWVHYHAPLDSWPRLVQVTKRFKNGKLRIKASELTFTADSGHLSRFRRPQ